MDEKESERLRCEMADRDIKDIVDRDSILARQAIVAKDFRAAIHHIGWMNHGDRQAFLNTLPDDLLKAFVHGSHGIVEHTQLAATDQHYTYVIASTLLRSRKGQGERNG